jgi:hypothetical protein
MPLVNDALKREIEGQMKTPRGRVLRATALAMISDYMSLNAAGCAFYATLSLFPAITMLISIYGMVFDPVTVEPQLAYLKQIMPAAAYQLLSDRVQQLVSNHSGTLSISLIISFMIAFWSAASGTKSLIWALNFAYRRKETRGVLHFQALAFVMTFGAVLAAVLGICVLVGLPTAFGAWPLRLYRPAGPSLRDRGPVRLRADDADAVLQDRAGPQSRGRRAGAARCGHRLHPLAARLRAVLLLREPRGELQRRLRRSRRCGRRHDVVLGERLCDPVRRGTQCAARQGATAAPAAGEAAEARPS